MPQGDDVRPAVPVVWSDGPPPFAYVARRVLARGKAAADHIDAITQQQNNPVPLGGRDEAPEVGWFRIDGLDDPLSVAALARADGFAVQVDHVFFAHGCDPCCGPHPSETFDALVSDPWRSTPWRSTPWRSTPWRSTPWRSTDASSSARPATARVFPPRALAAPETPPRILVLDTGLADPAYRPALLNAPGRLSGDADLPDVALIDESGTIVWPPDDYLDPVAGHGTFIAGIIEQLAPGCTITVRGLVNPLGDVAESVVVGALYDAANEPAAMRPDIVSCSFGGPAESQPAALASAVAKVQLAGIVVVASAGNEGTAEPQYPAALDGVVGVGALGPDGPTPWTNYGTWVDACAPGLDLVSSFFTGFDGAFPRVNTEDPDSFDGWARWSGTSFAAPVVVAALAREIILGTCTAKEAVTRVIDSPSALRIRCLGTVVNV
jgi:hypothetical protein